jgi:hypothetical protein
MKKTDVVVMAGAVVELVKQAIDPLKARNAALEARLAALEAKPSVKFCGVFEGGKSYEPGDARGADGGTSCRVLASW